MSTQIEATFAVTNWDENGFDEAVGVAKLTRASVSKEYSGDIEGTSATEWLMAYHPDKTAAFVGIERIRGTVGGRKGSLVLQHVGTFEDGAATAKLTVVSGTDELRDASGSGEFVADPAGKLTLTLNI